MCSGLADIKAKADTYTFTDGGKNNNSSKTAVLYYMIA
jgi:hypothetical protein